MKNTLLFSISIIITIGCYSQKSINELAKEKAKSWARDYVIKADKDKNGTISKDEYDLDPPFNMMDRINKNGVLSFKEIARFQSAYERRKLIAIENNCTYYQDIVYTSNPVSKSQKLDILVPNKFPSSGEKGALIIYIHGGGFVGGDKVMVFGDGQNEITKRGFVFASINYRLFEEAPYPANVIDCFSALRFLKANADKYNIDTNRIGLWGSSAGAYLCLMMGTAAKDPAFIEGDYKEVSHDVKVVCSMKGPADLLISFKTEEEEGELEFFAKGFGGDVNNKNDLIERLQKASPLNRVNKSLQTQFLIVHGDKDNTVDVENSRNLVRKFEENEVIHEYIEVAGAGHGNWDGISQKEKNKVYNQIFEYFEKKLL